MPQSSVVNNSKLHGESLILHLVLILLDGLGLHVETVASLMLSTYYLIS